MSVTTTYNYSSGAGFSYNPSKIGFVSDEAQLIPTNNPGQFFESDIAAADFDPTIFEVVGGVLRQIDTRPANFQNYFAWNTQINGNYGSASLTVNAVNGAAIAGSVLDLTGSTTKYVELSGATALGNIGTIAFVYKPNYSGTPSSPQYMFNSGNQLNNNQSLLSLYHNSSDGWLYLLCTTSAGGVVFFATLGAPWSPVAGTSYTFTYQLDVTNGATKLFINGVQYGATLPQTGLRGASNWFRVGTNSDASANADFSISSLVFYNAVVSPTNVTPLHDYIYNSGSVDYPSFTYPGPVGSVQSWSSMVITDVNNPRYILNNLYWNGSSWVSSDGSYAQSSPSSIVQTNITSLPVVDTMTIRGVYPNSNTMQSGTVDIALTYVGQTYSEDDPTIVPTSTVSMDALYSFQAVMEATSPDGIKFYLSLSGTPYWFDGNSWVVSNGLYSQSNTAQEINTNASSLPIVLGAFVVPYAILHSDDGSTTPILTSLTMVSSYFGPAPTPPNVCTIFGYILDEKEQPIVGATVAVTNQETFINGDVVIAQGVRTTVTNSIGYFDIDLVETASMTTPALLTFDVTYTQQQVGAGFSPVTFTFGDAVIPNAPSANISSLTFV